MKAIEYRYCNCSVFSVAPSDSSYANLALSTTIQGGSHPFSLKYCTYPMNYPIITLLFERNYRIRCLNSLTRSSRVPN